MFKVRDSKDKFTAFFLEEEDGEIYLKFEYNEGETWCVAKVTTDGKLELQMDVPDDAGLTLEKQGYIVVTKE